ncbi:cupredoxin domain-containing protein [Paracoccus sphaerophysae]|uniref:Uncharacterized protein n=1 Tax=Paracoccus sphaerophysae TaxID=690417 RepID=A0A099FHH0_9RHOB|nr:hypothetical protein IC63_01665 [Paracoccus sphaerophysae]
MMKLVLAALLGAAFTMPAAAQTAPAATAPATTAPAATPAPAAAEDDADDDAPAATPTAAPAAAASVQHHDFGPSGIMVRSNREDLAPLTLASGKPVAEAEYLLKSGGYYRIRIKADGSQELALSGGDFFRAVWVNEVIVNDIEIRPMGVHSIEFDAAGEAEISFVAIVPGRYTLSVPGSSGATQQAVFTIQ